MHFQHSTRTAGGGGGRLLAVRLDARVGEHLHCTLFANGASAGKLCLRNAEFEELVAALGWSPDNDDPEFQALAREVGLGAKCVREARS